MHEAVQTTRGFNLIFIHRNLDDAGLTPNQFRVYAHISRRAGDGSCWESLDAMADFCGIHPDTLRGCIQELVARGMLVRVDRPGKTSLWRLTTEDKWVMTSPSPKASPGRPVACPVSRPKPSDTPPNQTGGVNSDTPPNQTGGVNSDTPPNQRGGSPPNQRGGSPPNQTGGKDTPEGYPRRKPKDNKRKGEWVPVPEGLRTKEFLDVWAAWLADRRERGKAVTQRAAELQLAKCAAMGVQKALLAVRTSIERGYQGIFEQHSTTNTNGHKASSRKGADRNAGTANENDTTDWNAVARARVERSLKQIEAEKAAAEAGGLPDVRREAAGGGARPG